MYNTQECQHRISRMDEPALAQKLRRGQRGGKADPHQPVLGLGVVITHQNNHCYAVTRFDLVSEEAPCAISLGKVLCYGGVSTVKKVALLRPLLHWRIR